MYPKFRAAVEFLEKREGRSALITSFDKLDEALKGKTGTLIRKNVTRSEESAAFKSRIKICTDIVKAVNVRVFLYFNRQSE